MSIMLGNVRAVSARAVITWGHVWIVDVDLDPDDPSVSAATVPTGPQTLSVTSGNGTVITMRGTVDPVAAGRWVAGIPLRLVAGGNGWDRPVEAQEFDSPSGVSSLTVEQATASEVGETVRDPQPTSLGLHWLRMAGPASRIFTCPTRDWYVDLAGVTQVGAWPSAVADPSVELLEWDPLQQRATLSTDAIVLPGTVLPTDPRLDGPYTIRDVEIIFDASGTRVTAWCSEIAITRFLGSLRNAVRELGGIAALASYEYQIVSQSGALLNLQAVPLANGSSSPAPDSQSVQVWPGMQGVSGTYLQGSKCRVVFLGQDYSNPMVVNFDGSLPVNVALDATSTVDIGPSAGMVRLAGGSTPAAPQGGVVISVFPSGTTMTGTFVSPVTGPSPVPFTAIMAIPGVIAGTIQTGFAKVTGK